MGSRMDRYVDEQNVPKRSDKNKALYKQIYNAYDEFENLVVPSNSREINITDLKKEITSREEYRDRLDYDSITNNNSVDNISNNTVNIKDMQLEEDNDEDEVYDINEILNKAVTSSQTPKLIEPTLSNEEYLKKLKLDNYKMKAEKINDTIPLEEEEGMSEEEEEALLKTANLSLEILSDLKSDNDSTRVSAPIVEDELSIEERKEDFYSSNYKFSKRDFEDKDDDELEEDDDEDYEKGGSGRFFFKILMLIFGILLVVLVLIYFINYFNRV